MLYGYGPIRLWYSDTLWPGSREQKWDWLEDRPEGDLADRPAPYTGGFECQDSWTDWTSALHRWWWMLQNQWPVGLHWQDLSTLNVSRKKLDLNITEETLHCSGARRSLQSSVSQSVYDSMMYHCLCLAFLLLRSGQSSKTLDKSLKYIQEKRPVWA